MQQDINPESYLEPYQPSKMERFEKIVNSFYLQIILAKRSILDFWQGLYTQYALVLV